MCKLCSWVVFFLVSYLFKSCVITLFVFFISMLNSRDYKLHCCSRIHNTRFNALKLHIICCFLKEEKILYTYSQVYNFTEKIKRMCLCFFKNIFRYSLSLMATCIGFLNVLNSNMKLSEKGCTIIPLI